MVTVQSKNQLKKMSVLRFFFVSIALYIVLQTRLTYADNISQGSSSSIGSKIINGALFIGKKIFGWFENAFKCAHRLITGTRKRIPNKGDTDNIEITSTVLNYDNTETIELTTTQLNSYTNNSGDTSDNLHNIVVTPTQLSSSVSSITKNLESMQSLIDNHQKNIFAHLAKDIKNLLAPKQNPTKTINDDTNTENTLILSPISDNFKITTTKLASDNTDNIKVTTTNSNPENTQNIVPTPTQSSSSVSATTKSIERTQSLIDNHQKPLVGNIFADFGKDIQNLLAPKQNLNKWIKDDTNTKNTLLLSTDRENIKSTSTKLASYNNDNIKATTTNSYPENTQTIEPTPTQMSSSVSATTKKTESTQSLIDNHQKPLVGNIFADIGKDIQNLLAPKQKLNKWIPDDTNTKNTLLLSTDRENIKSTSTKLASHNNDNIKATTTNSYPENTQNIMPTPTQLSSSVSATTKNTESTQSLIDNHQKPLVGNIFADIGKDKQNLLAPKQNLNKWIPDDTNTKNTLLLSTDRENIKSTSTKLASHNNDNIKANITNSYPENTQNIMPTPTQLSSSVSATTKNTGSTQSLIDNHQKPLVGNIFADIGKDIQNLLAPKQKLNKWIPDDTNTKNILLLSTDRENIKSTATKLASHNNDNIKAATTDSYPENTQTVVRTSTQLSSSVSATTKNTESTQSLIDNHQKPLVGNIFADIGKDIQNLLAPKPKLNNWIPDDTITENTRIPSLASDSVESASTKLTSDNTDNNKVTITKSCPENTQNIVPTPTQLSSSVSATTKNIESTQSLIDNHQKPLVGNIFADIGKDIQNLLAPKQNLNKWIPDDTNTKNTRLLSTDKENIKSTPTKLASDNNENIKVTTTYSHPDNTQNIEPTPTQLSLSVSATTKNIESTQSLIDNHQKPLVGNIFADIGKDIQNLLAPKQNLNKWIPDDTNTKNTRLLSTDKENIKSTPTKLASDNNENIKVTTTYSHPDNTQNIEPTPTQLSSSVSATTKNIESTQALIDSHQKPLVGNVFANIGKDIQNLLAPKQKLNKWIPHDTNTKNTLLLSTDRENIKSTPSKLASHNNENIKATTTKSYPENTQTIVPTPTQLSSSVSATTKTIESTQSLIDNHQKPLVGNIFADIGKDIQNLLAPKQKLNKWIPDDTSAKNTRLLSTDKENIKSTPTKLASDNNENIKVTTTYSHPDNTQNIVPTPTQLSSSVSATTKNIESTQSLIDNHQKPLVSNIFADIGKDIQNLLAPKPKLNKWIPDDTITENTRIASLARHNFKSASTKLTSDNTDNNKVTITKSYPENTQNIVPTPTQLSSSVSATTKNIESTQSLIENHQKPLVGNIFADIGKDIQNLLAPKQNLNKWIPDDTNTKNTLLLSTDRKNIKSTPTKLASDNNENIKVTTTYSHPDNTQTIVPTPTQLSSSVSATTKTIESTQSLIDNHQKPLVGNIFADIGKDIQNLLAPKQKLNKWIPDDTSTKNTRLLSTDKENIKSTPTKLASDNNENIKVTTTYSHPDNTQNIEPTPTQLSLSVSATTKNIESTQSLIDNHQKPLVGNIFADIGKDIQNLLAPKQNLNKWIPDDTNTKNTLLLSTDRKNIKSTPTKLASDNNENIKVTTTYSHPDNTQTIVPTPTQLSSSVSATTKTIESTQSLIDNHQKPLVGNIFADIGKDIQNLLAPKQKLNKWIPHDTNTKNTLLLSTDRENIKSTPSKLASHNNENIKATTTKSYPENSQTIVPTPTQLSSSVSATTKTIESTQSLIDNHQKPLVGNIFADIGKDIQNLLAPKQKLNKWIPDDTSAKNTRLLSTDKENIKSTPTKLASDNNENIKVTTTYSHPDNTQNIVPTPTQLSSSVSATTKNIESTQSLIDNHQKPLVSNIFADIGKDIQNLLAPKPKLNKWIPDDTITENTRIASLARHNFKSASTKLTSDNTDNNKVTITKSYPENTQNIVPTPTQLSSSVSATTKNIESTQSLIENHQKPLVGNIFADIGKDIQNLLAPKQNLNKWIPDDTNTKNTLLLSTDRKNIKSTPTKLASDNNENIKVTTTYSHPDNTQTIVPTPTQLSSSVSATTKTIESTQSLIDNHQKPLVGNIFADIGKDIQNLLAPKQKLNKWIPDDTSTKNTRLLSTDKENIKSTPTKLASDNNENIKVTTTYSHPDNTQNIVPTPTQLSSSVSATTKNIESTQSLIDNHQKPLVSNIFADIGKDIQNLLAPKPKLNKWIPDDTITENTRIAPLARHNFKSASTKLTSDNTDNNKVTITKSYPENTQNIVPTPTQLSSSVSATTKNIESTQSLIDNHQKHLVGNIFADIGKDIQNLLAPKQNLNKWIPDDTETKDTLLLSTDRENIKSTSTKLASHYSDNNKATTTTSYPENTQTIVPTPTQLSSSVSATTKNIESTQSLIDNHQKPLVGNIFADIGKDIQNLLAPKQNLNKWIPDDTNTKNTLLLSTDRENIKSTSTKLASDNNENIKVTTTYSHPDNTQNIVHTSTQLSSSVSATTKNTESTQSLIDNHQKPLVGNVFAEIGKDIKNLVAPTQKLNKWILDDTNTKNTLLLSPGRENIKSTSTKLASDNNDNIKAITTNSHPESTQNIVPTPTQRPNKWIPSDTNTGNIVTVSSASDNSESTSTKSTSDDSDNINVTLTESNPEDSQDSVVATTQLGSSASSITENMESSRAPSFEDPSFSYKTKSVRKKRKPFLADLFNFLVPKQK